MIKVQTKTLSMAIALAVGSSGAVQASVFDWDGWDAGRPPGAPVPVTMPLFNPVVQTDGLDDGLDTSDLTQNTVLGVNLYESLVSVAQSASAFPGYWALFYVAYSCHGEECNGVYTEGSSGGRYAGFDDLKRWEYGSDGDESSGYFEGNDHQALLFNDTDESVALVNNPIAPYESNHDPLPSVTYGYYENSWDESEYDRNTGSESPYEYYRYIGWQEAEGYTDTEEVYRYDRYEAEGIGYYDQWTNGDQTYTESFAEGHQESSFWQYTEGGEYTYDSGWSDLAYVGGTQTPLSFMDDLQVGGVEASYFGYSQIFGYDVNIDVRFGSATWGGSWNNGWAPGFEAGGAINGALISGTVDLEGSSEYVTGGSVEGSFIGVYADGLIGHTEITITDGAWGFRTNTLHDIFTTCEGCGYIEEDP